MSIHGECFDRGMSGGCNWECSKFLEGGCDQPGDIVEGEIDQEKLTPQQIREYFDDYEILEMYPDLSYLCKRETVKERIERVRQTIINERK